MKLSPRHGLSRGRLEPRRYAASPFVEANGRWSYCEASGRELVLLDQVVQGRTTNPEKLGRPRDIVVRTAQSLPDGTAVRRLARGAQIQCKFRFVERAWTSRQVEIVGADRFAVGHDHGPLDPILELPDV